MDNATTDNTRLNTGHSLLKYVIARHEEGNLQLFYVALEAGEEKALPVFSFEQLARAFLRSADLGPQWHLSTLYSGVLVSLLLGPYQDVRWVLPNPLPEPLTAEDALLNLVDRGSFVSFLLGLG